MASLDEIRAKLNIAATKIEDDTPPAITYEQYKMWHTLKKPKKVKKELTFSDDWRDTLSCPHCRHDYLHHVGIEMFNISEGSRTGDHIEIYDNTSMGWSYMNTIVPNNNVDGNMKDNPSSDRSGLLVLFSCESCGTLSKLAIAQHKGQSLIHWRIEE